MSTLLYFPGYRASWGSTNQWTRIALGPFVCEVYAPPDGEGTSEWTETFHPTFEDAEARARTAIAELW